MLSVEKLKKCGNKTETFGEKLFLFCKNWLQSHQIVESQPIEILKRFFENFIFQDISCFFLSSGFSQSC